MSPTPQAATVHVAGLSVAYRVWGSGDAPPLVLLHGLTSSGAAWEPVARILSRDRRVYAPDARGHGGTGRTGEYSFELMAADLAGFLAALELQRPVIVGHSMGGVAAYLYAASAADRLAGLVLSETPPPWPVHRPLPPRPPEPLSYDFGARAAVVGQLAAPAPGRRDALAAITAPTLVIGGGPESPFDQELMARMSRRIPGAAFTSIGGGHRLPATRPNALATAISDFQSTSIDLGENKI